MPDPPAATDAAPDAVLARPLDLGRRTMRNRIVQSPLSVCYQDEAGNVTDRTIAHYARRARGGVGMVITENFAVDPSGRQLPRHGLLGEGSDLTQLARLAEAVRDEGALAVIQLVHAGRYAGPWERYDEQPRWAPSAVPFELTPGRMVTPTEMTVDDITTVVGAFARAARLAHDAGFDGVHLHGAQGFLLCEFQSPRMNQRTDGYGGDAERRNRFPLEVVDAVVAEVGADMLVGYHLLSDEMMPGGFELGDAAAFAADLAAHGVDWVSPVPTTFESLRARMGADPTSNPTRYDPAAFAAIAAASPTPLFANGGLGDVTDAAGIVSSGQAVAVMQGRGLLADPDWAAKALAGRGDDIVRCACQPPTCLRSQMTGVVCHSWGVEDQARGYVG